MKLVSIIHLGVSLAISASALALEKDELIGTWEGTMQYEGTSHKETDPTLDFVKFSEDGKFVIAMKGPGEKPSVPHLGTWKILDEKLSIKLPGEKSPAVMEGKRRGGVLTLYDRKDKGTMRLRLVRPASLSAGFSQSDMKVALLLRSLHDYYESVDEKVRDGQKVETAKEGASIPIASREALLEELVGHTNIVSQLTVELRELRILGLGPDHPEILWIERLIRGLDPEQKNAESGSREVLTPGPHTTGHTGP